LQIFPKRGYGMYVRICAGLFGFFCELPVDKTLVVFFILICYYLNVYANKINSWWAYSCAKHRRVNYWSNGCSSRTKTRW